VCATAGCTDCRSNGGDGIGGSLSYEQVVQNKLSLWRATSVAYSIKRMIFYKDLAAMQLLCSLNI
jgi:hypothetical protein